ncbi:hypothetical protein BJX70DRAFT_365036 [Aspergillus crustosus]
MTILRWSSRNPPPANEKFGGIFKPTKNKPALVISPFMEREGRCCPRGSGVSTLKKTHLQAASETSGQGPSKRPWFSPWESRCEDCVCPLLGMRHFSAIRSVPVVGYFFMLWLAWYHSIPIILGGWRFILFLQVSFLFPCPCLVLEFRASVLWGRREEWFVDLANLLGLGICVP